jgi:formyl-CoA transferase
MALRVRDRTGRGQVVDSAIYEGVLALMEAVLPEWELAGYQRQRTGSLLPGAVPSNAYPTRDGDEILIAANRDTVFARLAQAMDRPELASSPWYETNESRSEHQVELDEIIIKWTLSLDADPLLELLSNAGVPAGRIYQTKDMLTDPHFAARQAIVRLMHPELGEFPLQNVVPRLSETPGAVRSLGPELGQHNEEIYKGLLGLDSKELERLQAAGIV